MPWSTPFEDPIELPDGRKLVTAGLTDQSWEWRVVAGDEIVIIGFEATRLEARVAGNAALFLTLASGWNR